MRQERSAQNLVVVLLAVAVLAMSIGFATYSQNLTITGTATFKKALWSVHFDTEQTISTSGSTITSPPTPTVTNTTATYTVTLSKPGDVYTFDIDVINDGTIDAKLDQVTLTSSVNGAYIGHSVKIGANTYSETTSTGLNIPLAAAANNTPGRQTVTVKVEYLLPADAASLPTSNDVQATLTVTLHYIDALPSA